MIEHMLFNFLLFVLLELGEYVPRKGFSTVLTLEKRKFPTTEKNGTRQLMQLY